MDPQAADVTSDRAILTNIFDTLVQRNAKGKLEPDLATSWKRINKTTWRLHLRKGVKFQNGNNFTWQDVKFTLNRLAKPKISEYLNFGSKITLVKPVNGDPWTIDIKTRGSVPYFIRLLPNIFIMDKESTESRSEGQIGLKPIGTGPYRLVKWVRNSYIKLKVNKQYWSNQPSIKQVVIYPITEPSTRFAAISSGKVDLLQGVPVTLIKRIKHNPKIRLVSRPSRRSIFLQLTNKPGTPMAKLQVRKAMYMAINERAIVSKLLLGHGFPSSQVPDPETVGYNKDIKRPPYNIKRARALLKKAGYEKGFEITLAGPNNRYVRDKQIEATIASQLAKISIKVRVNSMPKAVYFPRVAQHDFNFDLIGWLDAPQDFGRTFSKLLQTVNAEKGYGGLNGTNYSNPLLDKQYVKASRLIDSRNRGKALRKLNKMAMKQVAVIPLHYQENDYAVLKGLGIHFKPRPDKYLVFKDMSIKAK
jgi:peptide/nickel transport system substrate-binding protein